MDSDIINESNCVDHYRLDVRLCRDQLKKYDKTAERYAFTYATLLDTFVVMLQDKYQKFIDGTIDDMPGRDLDIYEELTKP